MTKPAIPESVIQAALAKLHAEGDPEDFYSSVLIPAPEAAELSYAFVPAEWVSRKKLSLTRRELLWALRKLGRKKREADLRCADLAAKNARLIEAGNRLFAYVEDRASTENDFEAINGWRDARDVGAS